MADLLYQMDDIESVNNYHIHTKSTNFINHYTTADTMIPADYTFSIAGMDDMPNDTFVHDSIFELNPIHSEFKQIPNVSQNDLDWDIQNASSLGTALSTSFSDTNSISSFHMVSAITQPTDTGDSDWQAPEKEEKLTKKYTEKHSKHKHADRHTKFRCQWVDGETQTECKSLFSRPYDLERHIQTIHQKKGIKCPKCKKAFSRSDALVRHTRSAH